MRTYVIDPTQEQEKMMTTFFEEQHISFFKEDDTPPNFVLDGIAKSREDFEAGRVFSFEEFKQRLNNAR